MANEKDTVTVSKYTEAIKLAVMFVSIGISFGVLQSQVSSNKEDIIKMESDVEANTELATENAKDMGIVKNDIDYIKKTSEKTYDLVRELSSRD